MRPIIITFKITMIKQKHTKKHVESFCYVTKNSYLCPAFRNLWQEKEWLVTLRSD